MACPRYPQHDSIVPRPNSWVPIALAPGTEPNAYGHEGSFLWDDLSDAGTTVDLTSVRRNGERITIISRVPERW